jgi:hypothetical protein
LLYDGFGAVLTSTIPITLTGAMPDFPDAATGLVHLGNGRWYDPSLGRPLQPNPAGSPPTVPQALNRYAAGPLGQPGVAQALINNGFHPAPAAYVGAIGNATLELAGRRVLVESGELVVQGSAPALMQGLRGLGEAGIPLEFGLVGSKGGQLGELAIFLSGRIPLFGRQVQRSLVNRLAIYRATTRGSVGLIDQLPDGRFLFNQYNTTIDTAGLEVRRFHRGLLLGEARLLRTAASAGVTFGIDALFELYGATEGIGRWGNPYWTTPQKAGQAFLVVTSDVTLAAGLAFAGFGWYIVIPVAFVWAITSDNIFASLPLTSQLYHETRDLRPLE